MKVRLKETTRLDATQGVGGWLRPGVVYTVLAIEGAACGRHEYRIVADSQGTPALFDARLFEVVDGRLPSSWVASVQGEQLELQPSRWAEAGFWERFFDGDPGAVAAFAEERAKIIASTP